MTSLQSGNYPIFTNPQKLGLEAIAATCGLEGGFGVYWARSLLHKSIGFYNDDVLCLPPPAPLTSTSQNNSNALTVQPNPAFDDITILSNTFLIKKVQLFNLLGQFMTSKENINNIQTQLSVSQLPEASYLLRIELENGELISKQVIIKK